MYKNLSGTHIFIFLVNIFDLGSRDISPLVIGHVFGNHYYAIRAYSDTLEVGN